MSQRNYIEAHILLSDWHGVYIPQTALEVLDPAWFNKCAIGDLETIAEGHEAEWYWDAWEVVLNNAHYTDPQGIGWTLYHDGDLWAIPDGFTDEQWDKLFW